ncbi:MAG: aspartyl/asparaginyl beta-hydroxylase domain-containing protein [Bacteroidota bacterium]|nr:aspartyl/asparaginyl beta-hydroxylase domain-containing protein [Bacteroidota bacterium]
MSILKFALLKIPVPVHSIQKEVAALQENNWQPHINRYHYEGEWTVLSLRSPGGGPNTFAEAINQEEYADTSLMALCPSIRQLLNQLHCEKLSARLLSLHPGAVIKEHTDKELCFEKGEARLHFPIFTHSLVEFFIDDTRVRMNEGECWYINANLPHRLANKGTSARVHLVIDCKVNDWLRHIFQNDFIHKDELSDTEITLRNEPAITNTILELRRQANSTSDELADKLEKQLQEARKGYRLPVAGTNEEITATIITFIRSIGIPVREEPLEENTFLPGMQIRNGELVIDKNKLLYPGDLLHEAGHIAVMSANDRPRLDEQFIKESQHRDAEEMMAIAWSYAACIHLAIDPLIVFHENGYKGGGSYVVENFRAGKFFGTPMLQWHGMTIEPRHAASPGHAFPKMIKWIRE